MIEADDLLRAQGADPARLRARRSVAVELAHEALVLGRRLLHPAVAWRRVVVAGHRHDALLLEPAPLSLSGPMVAEQLGGAHEVVAMVCTIGGELEDEVSRRFARGPAIALDLDALGSVALERAVSSARSRLTEIASAQGWQVSPPLSPGETGWPLRSGQRQLFRLVDAAPIGVRLGKSAIMEPRKSRSLVLGLGPDMSCATSPCERCDLADHCAFRQLYEGEHGRGATGS